MTYIVADTCIIFHILRNNNIGQAALGWLRTLEDDYTLVVSVVTKGELEALKLQQQWSDKRCSALYKFLQEVTYIDINHADEELLERYAIIDGYSKGKVSDGTGNIKKGSAIKMGKNDLWIAATTSVIDAILLTSDGDFDHLAKVFIQTQKFK